MSTSPDFRLAAQARAIARLFELQEENARRLARIEAALGITAPAEAPPPSAPPPEAAPAIEPEPLPAQPIAPELQPEPAPEPEPVLSSAPPPPAEAPGLETRLGLVWINRIGVLTLVLGVAFFFKYAVDNEWIGETGRVILGILAGFATLGVSERLFRSGHRIYAQGVSGCGLAILYLSFYASFGFYHLVPAGAAFVLMVLTTATSGALAARYNSMAIAVLGLAGGYSTPVLLSTGEDRPWVLFGYVLILNLGAFFLAKVKRWPKLEILAFAGTVILYAGWFADRFKTEKRLVATVFALAYYALFALAETRLLLPVVQVLAAFAMLPIWEPPELVFLPLSLALGAAGLVIAERRNRPEMVTAAFSAFWFVYSFWQAQYTPPRAVMPLLATILAAFFLFLNRIPWLLLVRRVAVPPQDLLLLAVNGIACYSNAYALLHRDYGAWLGLFAVGLAGIHLAVGYHLWKTSGRELTDPKPILLCVGMALAFLTLAIPIQFSGYRITIAWAVEAAALVWIGRRTDTMRLLIVSMLVFGLTFFRLVTFDAQILRDPYSYQALVNTRFLTFLVSAIAFGAGAYWIGTAVPALALYLTAHVILLAGLILEALGWAARVTPPENLRSVESISVTLLMAAYSVALIAAGVAGRLRLNRILGLALMALVILKLYLSDVWMVGRFYRIVAFTALGLLLLGTSFVYSRYRGQIEQWWKRETGAD